MRAQTLTSTVLHYDDAGGFGVAADDSRQLWFFHLRSFADTGNRSAPTGGTATFAAAAPHQERFHRLRTAGDGSLKVVGGTSWPGHIRYLHGRSLTQAELLEAVSGKPAIVLFDDVDFEEICLEGVLRTSSALVFARCRFGGNLVLIDNDFAGDLCFMGCRFSARFSLKNSRVAGAIHMEASDFSGAGGASFRGVRCQALYLDFGVTGPNDMVWLNETTIAGPLVLGGRFASEIQIMGDQDGSTERSMIGQIVVGEEYYGSQQINRTEIAGTLRLSRLDVDGAIELHATAVAELSVEDCTAGTFAVTESRIEGPAGIRDSRFLSEETALSIENSLLATRLVLKETEVAGLLSLEGTTVDKHATLNNCHFGTGGRLSVYGFLADTVHFLPADMLYGGRRSVFTNPRFRLLKRERDLDASAAPSATGERMQLVQEYTALRRWLGDAGLLALEDEAFYNMRRLGERGILRQLLFNYVFGWGVRLWNVLWSSTVIILLYALLFALHHKVPASSALTLSVQSFFGTVFGEWGKLIPSSDNPVSDVSMLSVSEGILGVLFITVLIGAYMRKLLR